MLEPIFASVAEMNYMTLIRAAALATDAHFVRISNPRSAMEDSKSAIAAKGAATEIMTAPSVEDA